MEGNKVKDMPEKWSGVQYHIISKKKKIGENQVMLFWLEEAEIASPLAHIDFFIQPE